MKIPNIPIKYRNKIRTLQKTIGQKKFFNKLIKLDPLIKNKISLTDVQRSIRAYEVKLFTKKSLYDWFSSTRSDFLDYNLSKFFLQIRKYPKNFTCY